MNRRRKTKARVMLISAVLAAAILWTWNILRREAPYTPPPDGAKCVVSHPAREERRSGRTRLKKINRMNKSLRKFESVTSPASATGHPTPPPAGTVAPQHSEGREKDKAPLKEPLAAAPATHAAQKPHSVEPLAILTLHLPPAFTGLNYYAPLVARGGAAPYNWKIASGSLPPGLTLDNANSAICGVATESAFRLFSLSVSDSASSCARADYSIIVGELDSTAISRPGGVRSQPLYLTTGSLPDAKCEQSYSAILQANGGRPPYQWSVAEGSLPDGLCLGAEHGLIDGVPRTAGWTAFKVGVSDSDGNHDVAALGIKIHGEDLSILTAGLADGKIEVPYSHKMEAIGGIPPYLWSVSSGSIPKGLVFDREHGVISGTPAEAVETSLTMGVTDSEGAFDEKIYSLMILSPTLSIVTSTVPAARIGVAYEAVLTAAGGSPPYLWALGSGKLPSGLSLSQASGTISGTPSGEAGDYTFTALITDSAGETARRAITLSLTEESSLAVKDLIATPSDSKAALTWKNPESDSYSHTVIVRSTSSFAASPQDGSVIYSGAGGDFLDLGLSNETRYHYTAFAYDTNGIPGAAGETAQAVVYPRAVSLSGQANPFADAVVSFNPLSSSGFGKPEYALGAPSGGGLMQGSTNVVSLHARSRDGGDSQAACGGSITVQFTDNIIINGPGADFTVFENVFYIGGDPEQRWMEPALVSVSKDGMSFFTFQVDFVPHFKDGQLNLNNPYCYLGENGLSRGFAGISPVFSRSGVPDPRSPAVAGGDSFDLSAITQARIDWVRYVRITSTGDGWITDINGDLVRHICDMGACGGAGSSGFDLDAVCAVNY